MITAVLFDFMMFLLWKDYDSTYLSSQFYSFACICVVDLYSTIKYDSLGCYKHEVDSKMIVLEGKDPYVLDGNYTLRTDAVDKCALAAMKRRHEVFAVHDGGQCLVGDSPYTPTFKKYGISQDCESDGKGGSGAIHVYFIGEAEGILYLRKKVRIY